MACVRFLRRRGPAGLRDLFLLLSKLWLYALCLGLFARAKEGGCIITLGVFRVLLKRWTSACQKGSFAVFWDRVAFIDSSGAKAAVHAKQPRSPMKGTGAVFLRHFMERARNAAICARVQVPVGSK